MASTSSQKELLALIYQHLVQVGCKKAAKQLEQQSDQNIVSSLTVSLLDIYTDWKKTSSPTVSFQDIYKEWINSSGNAKKRKASDIPEDLQPKKLRVSDPASSSESSEKDERDDEMVKPFHTNSTAMVGREKGARKEKNVVKNVGSAGNIANSKGSQKKASAIMAKPASPAKSVPSKPETPTKTTGIAKQANKQSERNDSSESEDEAPEFKLTQIPVKAAESSSETVSSEGSEEEEIPVSQNTPAAKATLKTSQAKSMLPKSISATPVSSKTAQEKASSQKPGRAAPNQVKAETGKVTSPAKAARIQKTEVSESSNSDESEEEEAAKQVKASPPKNSLAVPVSMKSARGKVSTPAPPTKSAAATPNQVKGGMGKIVTQPAKSSSDSTDDSDSEEETQVPKPTAKAANSKTLQANAKAVKNIPATPLSSKVAQGKVPSPASSTKLASAAPSQAKSGVGKILTPAKAAGIQNGESSESSDSSSEEETQQPKAANSKTLQANAKAVKSIPTSPLSNKIAQGKVSSPASGTRLGSAIPSQAKSDIEKVMTPAKAAGIQKGESSESSDGSSEEETQQPKSTAKAANYKTLQANAKAVKNIPATPLSSKVAQGKVPSPASGTKLASPTPSQAKSGVGKIVTPAKDAGIQNEESSESSDSSSEEETQQPKPTAKAANYKTLQANAKAVKNIPATPLSSKIAQGKVPASGTKLAPATPSQARSGVGKVVTPAKAAGIQNGESSESSDSSSEEEAQQPQQANAALGKNLPATSVSRKSAQRKVSTPAQGTKSADLAKAGQRKAVTLAEAVRIVTQPPESFSESSDISESEEDTQPRPAAVSKTSQAKATAVKNIPATPLSSKVAPGPKSTSATPNQAKARTGNTVIPEKAAAIPKLEISDSSDSSDSKYEALQAKAVPVKNALTAPVSIKSTQGKAATPVPSTKPPATRLNQAKASSGQATTPAKAAKTVTVSLDSSSSDSSSSEEEIQKPRPAAKVAVSKTSQAKATEVKNIPATPLSSKVAPGTKSTSATPNQAKARTGHAVIPEKAAAIPKLEISDSSASSDSECEALQAKAVPVKNALTAPVSIKSTQGKAATPVPSMKPPATRLNQAKASSGKATTPAKAAKTVTVSLDSSSSDSSSSEEEIQKPKLATNAELSKKLQAKNILATSTFSKGPRGKVPSLAADTKLASATPNQVKAETGKVVTPAKAAGIEKGESSVSSDSSDSEEEEAAQKLKPSPKPWQVKSAPGKNSLSAPVSNKLAKGKISAAATPNLAKAGQRKVVTSAKAAGIVTQTQESSSDSSDVSNSDEEFQKKSKPLKVPVRRGVKRKARHSADSSALDTERKKKPLELSPKIIGDPLKNDKKASAKKKTSNEESSFILDTAKGKNFQQKAKKLATPSAENVLANSTSEAKPVKSKGVSLHPFSTTAKQQKTSENLATSARPLMPFSAQKDTEVFTIAKSFDNTSDLDPTQTLLLAISPLTKNATTRHPKFTPGRLQNLNLRTASAMKDSGEASEEDVSEAETSDTDTEMPPHSETITLTSKSFRRSGKKKDKKKKTKRISTTGLQEPAPSLRLKKKR
uniref:Treacle protein isoform X9 n=1 Tax=Geotrypetes seraphini TaxID=260995 RepID=A0A6P8P2T1_GEOSA|nr:treacle protein isoform X9 [Geotrypetes seraphini]